MHSPSASRFGRYQIGPVLGEGGMGVVVHALDMTGGTAVALKVLRRDASDRDRTRFAMEARAVARLNHPNIVPVHEVGDVDGRPFLAMAFVEGRSLRSELEQRPSGRIDAETIRDLGIKLCDALETSHRAGVLHRDLKPDNILLAAEDDRPILVDFGLARGHTDADRHASLDGTRLTQDGEVVGTPLYMAPEQFDKDAWGDTGTATDVWGLAATLYHAAGGRPPFQASSALMIMAAQLNDPPPALTALDDRIPAWLDGVLRSGLQPSPRDRPTITELHDAFLARRAPIGASTARLRHAALALAALVLTAALIGAGVTGYQAWRCSIPNLLSRAESAELPEPETLALLAASAPELDRAALLRLKPALLRLSLAKASLEDDRRPHCLTLHGALIATALDAGGEVPPETATELLALRPLDGPSLQALTPLLLRPQGRRALLALAREEALAIAPDPERARLEGRAHELSGDVEQAFEVLDRGLAAAPTSIALLDQAARLAFFSRRGIRTQELLTRRLKLEPFDPSMASLAIRQQARSEGRDHRRARALIADLESRHPSPIWAIEREALAALDAPGSIWPPAQRLPPPPAAVATRWDRELALARLLDDRLLKAELIARRRLYQSSPDAIAANIAFEARWLINLAEFERAAALVDRALESKRLAAHHIVIDLRLTRAGIATARNNPELATAMIEPLLAEASRSPLSPDHTGRLAQLLEALRRSEDGIRLIERQFGREPEDTDLALDLAGLQVRLAVSRVNRSNTIRDARPRAAATPHIESDRVTQALVASARRVLDRRLAEEARDVSALCLKISTLVFENRFDDALALGKRGLTFGFGSTELRLEILSTMRFSRQPARMIDRFLAQSLACLPSDANLNSWSARRLFEAGRITEAIGPARLAFRRYNQNKSLARIVLAGASRETSAKNIPALARILRRMSQDWRLVASAAGLLDVHLESAAAEIPPEQVRALRELIITSCLTARRELIKSKTSHPDDLSTILALRAAMQDAALGRRRGAGHRIVSALRKRLPTTRKTRELAATHLVELKRPDAAGAVLLGRLKSSGFSESVQRAMIRRAWDLSIQCYLPRLTLRAYEEATRIGLRKESMAITAVRSAKILGQHALAASIARVLQRSRPLETTSSYLRCVHAAVTTDTSAARAAAFSRRLQFPSAGPTLVISTALLHDVLDPDDWRRELQLVRSVLRPPTRQFEHDTYQRMQIFGQAELGGRRLVLISRIKFDQPKTLAGLTMLHAGWTADGVFRLGPANPERARELLGRSLSLAPESPALLFAALFVKDEGSAGYRSLCERVINHPGSNRTAKSLALARLGRHDAALKVLGYRRGEAPPTLITIPLAAATVLADAGRHDEELELLDALRRRFRTNAVVAARRAQGLAAAARRQGDDQEAVRVALDACAEALEITPSLHRIPELAVELALRVPPCEEVIRAGAAVRGCAFQAYDCRALEVLGAHAADNSRAATALFSMTQETWPGGRWSKSLQRRLASRTNRD